MSEPSTTDEMVRQARLVQGRQRIGTHGEYDGKLRDDDTLLFYADTVEHVEEMLRAVLDDFGGTTECAVEARGQGGTHHPDPEPRTECRARQ